MNEDTPFVVLMRDLLQNHGDFNLLSCGNGDDAYRVARACRPDLVILDIQMGDEERSWTILELLTLDPDTRPIPVIVCSEAMQSLHDHQPWLDKFGVCALPKPFDLGMLLEMVHRVLGDPRCCP